MERYNRNILIDEIKKEGQLKLLSSKVLVAGAGGLGTTVLANLASVGIGTIGIIDNDVIELTNLNRQFIHKYENIGKVKVESAKQWIKDFNPDIKINIYKTRLNNNNASDIYKDYDIVIDCFDSYKSKFLLNEMAIKEEKPLVSGGVSEFEGQVTLIMPHKTACLRCIFQDLDTEDYKIKGVISPAVSTIASIEAMETVKYLLNIGMGLQNKLLIFDGLSMKFKTINIERNKQCKCCNAQEKNLVKLLKK